jgi:hypothetical protein
VVDHRLPSAARRNIMPMPAATIPSIRSRLLVFICIRNWIRLRISITMIASPR